MITQYLIRNNELAGLAIISIYIENFEHNVKLISICTRVCT